MKRAQALLAQEDAEAEEDEMDGIVENGAGGPGNNEYEGEVVIPETEGGALGFEAAGANGGEPRERRVNGL